MSATLLRRLPRVSVIPQITTTTTTTMIAPLLALRRYAKSVARRPVLDPLARRAALIESLTQRNNGEEYPRVELNHIRDGTVLRHIEFLERYGGDRLRKGEKCLGETVTIRGRLRSYRDVSSKLIFFDIVQDHRKLQCVSSIKFIGGDLKVFYERNTAMRTGDIVAVTGYPARTQSGELSVYATSYPELLAPCFHQIPDSLQNPEKLKQHRHLDLLVHPSASQTLKLRSKIINQIRKHLLKLDFVEVQTPILSYSTGGAIARPFLTAASSTHRPLALRIAPELWLKRLLVGGMDRVFELGPQFRNEGIDATHNPEFTTCELYQSFGRLQDVMTLTENLFREIDRMSQQLKAPGAICDSLEPLDPDISDAIALPWTRLEFIPALEEALGEPLPCLENREEADLVHDLLELCGRVNVTITNNPQGSSSLSPAKILDRLAGLFLEPQCQMPTWIMYHPECMSPLAKSGERKGRRVSERVELFVQGRELVNAYEEENSPFEQRRKFQEQAKAGGGEEEGEDVIDESYCATLEWGLPPTAGWGLGVDRLVMLFSGQERIADVMAFGGLRGAVNQGGVNAGVSPELVEGRFGGGKGRKGKIGEREGRVLGAVVSEDVAALNEMVGELARSLKGR